MKRIILFENSMRKNKRIISRIALVLLAVAIVFVTEQVFKPGYAIKSLVKVLSFMGAILIYCVSSHQQFKKVIRLYKIKNIKPLLFCMILFFVGTASAFLIFRNYIDLQSIRQSLISKENLTKSNCLFVFGYIILCNSFLEEIFFRGFVSGLFLNKWAGRIFSAVLFSIYHIGIFITWFNPLIFVLCIVGLAVVGLFLQWLSEKNESILASYITHACANVAINIIGILLIFEVI